MELKKGEKLKHHKGGRYTIIEQGTHSETLEEVIIYQNDKDKKVWVRPLRMFYEDVEYKGEHVPRFEIIKRGRHGGETTNLIDLPVGTKFHVHNGVWDGEIISLNDEKHLLIKGRSIENAMKIYPEDTLDISIIN